MNRPQDLASRTLAAGGSRDNAADWWREVGAGFNGALTALPVVLTLGLLAFSPLGTGAPHVALLAAFSTAFVGGLVHTAFSRARMPVGGPSSPTAVTLAALVAQLVADPPMAVATAAGLRNVLALCGLAVLGSGLLQMLFAWLGLARLARVVPQPVLAGFMNGTALLALLAQVPLMLGLPPGAHPGSWDLAAAHPGGLLLGLGTAAVIWAVARQRPRWPASLLGLVAGTAAYLLWAQLGGAPGPGLHAGDMPPAWPWPLAVTPLWGSGGLDLLQAQAAPVALTALALATIGALESSLNVRAVDQLLNARHDPRRELLALGCGNVVCGLRGGVRLAATRIRALATLQAGGQGRRAVNVGSVVLGVMYVAGGPWLASLPQPVLAGVMLVVAAGMADRWTGRLLARWWAGDHSRHLAMSLGTVALVVGATLWKGMAAGVALGVLLSMVAFATRMNRSPVHDQYMASTRPSRRIYPAPVEALLEPLRAGITVFELEGALFFGTSERLLDEADALPANCRWLVLDLHLVSAIDESGAVALQQLVARLQARDVQVALAGWVEGGTQAQALRSYGLHLARAPDADRAVEAAELALLAALETAGQGTAAAAGFGVHDVRAMAPVPLAHTALLAGLDPQQTAIVTAHLQPRRLQAGEQLFAEGDPGDCLYVVSEGSVSILSLPDRHGRTQRYLSVSPGMVLGETAMYDGGGRTAGAVADVPTQVHALTLAALDDIGHRHPDVAIRLHRNLALHLSQRLRGAAGAWRAGNR